MSELQAVGTCPSFSAKRARLRHERGSRYDGLQSCPHGIWRNLLLTGKRSPVTQVSCIRRASKARLSWRPLSLARRLGVSHATAIKTISRLKREGLATGLPYHGVFLTDTGQALAERTRSRHRIVVNLRVALGVPTEVGEADVEEIEHHVSEATLKAFAHFLQKPVYDMRTGKR
jgi:Mn-dependent DtxR family transcriptional regulator